MAAALRRIRERLMQSSLVAAARTAGAHSRRCGSVGPVVIETADSRKLDEGLRKFEPGRFAGACEMTDAVGRSLRLRRATSRGTPWRCPAGSRAGR
jgi:hypothetical protein